MDISTKTRQTVYKGMSLVPEDELLKIPIFTHRYTLASYSPMERLAIDSIGPLPKSDEGYTHILTVVDCFTRWIELYPIKDVTADLAIKALLKHFGTFGQPSQIIHDNGSQFANEKFTQLMLLAGIEQIPILPYSSEENGIVERMHQEILKHLRGIIYDKNVIDNWHSL